MTISLNQELFSARLCKIKTRLTLSATSLDILRVLTVISRRDKLESSTNAMLNMVQELLLLLVSLPTDPTFEKRLRTKVLYVLLNAYTYIIFSTFIKESNQAR